MTECPKLPNGPCNDALRDGECLTPKVYVPESLFVPSDLRIQGLGNRFIFSWTPNPTPQLNIKYKLRDDQDTFNLRWLVDVAGGGAVTTPELERARWYRILIRGEDSVSYGDWVVYEGYTMWGWDSNVKDVIHEEDLVYHLLDMVFTD